jgi:hypothetical protein
MYVCMMYVYVWYRYVYVWCMYVYVWCMYVYVCMYAWLLWVEVGFSNLILGPSNRNWYMQ